MVQHDLSSSSCVATVPLSWSLGISCALDCCCWNGASSALDSFPVAAWATSPRTAASLLSAFTSLVFVFGGTSQANAGAFPAASAGAASAGGGFEAASSLSKVCPVSNCYQTDRQTARIRKLEQDHDAGVNVKRNILPHRTPLFRTGDGPSEFTGRFFLPLLV